MTWLVFFTYRDVLKVGGHLVVLHGPYTEKGVKRQAGRLAGVEYELMGVSCLSNA